MATQKEMAAVTSRETPPENQVNPKWAEQFGQAFAAGMQAGMQKASVVDNVKEPEPLTGEDEQKKYDRMLEQDFMKIDPKTRKVGKDRTLYKPVHVYPQWQTANPNEFVAWFVIENYKWVTEADESNRRQIIGSFNIRCKQFCVEYKATVVQAIPELEEETNERAA